MLTSVVAAQVDRTGGSEADWLEVGATILLGAPVVQVEYVSTANPSSSSMDAEASSSAHLSTSHSSTAPSSVKEEFTTAHSSTASLSSNTAHSSMEEGLTTAQCPIAHSSTGEGSMIDVSLTPETSDQTLSRAFRCLPKVRRFDEYLKDFLEALKDIPLKTKLADFIGAIEAKGHPKALGESLYKFLETDLRLHNLERAHEKRIESFNLRKQAVISRLPDLTMLCEDYARVRREPTRFTCGSALSELLDALRNKYGDIECPNVEPCLEEFKAIVEGVHPGISFRNFSNNLTTQRGLYFANRFGRRLHILLQRGLQLLAFRRELRLAENRINSLQKEKWNRNCLRTDDLDLSLNWNREGISTDIEYGILGMRTWDCLTRSCNDLANYKNVVKVQIRIGQVFE